MGGDVVCLVYIFKMQQHSFYELIINKARGKSGPVNALFYVKFLFIKIVAETSSCNVLVNNSCFTLMCMKT